MAGKSSKIDTPKSVVGHAVREPLGQPGMLWSALVFRGKSTDGAGTVRSHTDALAAGSARASAPEAGSATPSMPALERVLGHPGGPLPAASRADMESRLGFNFRAVRIHDDAEARRSADEVDAAAWTIGTHIAIGSGTPALDSPAGRGVLAHELPRTIQQRGLLVFPAGPVALGTPDDRLEVDAHRGALQVLTSAPFSPLSPVAEPMLQRQVAAPVKQSSLFVSPGYKKPKSESCEVRCSKNTSDEEECENCCVSDCCALYPEDKKEECKLGCTAACNTPRGAMATVPMHSSSVTPAGLQRKRAGEDPPSVDHNYGGPVDKRLSLQPLDKTQAKPNQAPPIVHEVLRSSGQPLGTEVRAFMEPRFGHDFSRVRVHTDMRAVDSVRSVNALAYTIGDHMVFGAGRFVPGRPEGRTLIAHELTHVVQQSGSGGSRVGQNSEERALSPIASKAAHVVKGDAVTQRILPIGNPDCREEQEAEAVAAAALSCSSSSPSPLIQPQSAIGSLVLRRTLHEEDPGYTSPLPSNEKNLPPLSPQMIKGFLLKFNEEVAAIIKNHAFFNDPQALAFPAKAGIVSTVQPLNSKTKFKLTILFDPGLRSSGRTEETAPGEILMRVVGAKNLGKRVYLETFYHELLHAVLLMQGSLTTAEQKQSDIYTKFANVVPKLKPQRVNTDDVVTRTLLYYERELGLKPGRLDVLRKGLGDDIFNVAINEGFVYRKETKAFQAMAQQQTGGAKPQQASFADLASFVAPELLKIVNTVVLANRTGVLKDVELDKAKKLFSTPADYDTAESTIQATPRLETVYKALIAALAPSQALPVSGTSSAAASPSLPPTTGVPKKAD